MSVSAASGSVSVSGTSAVSGRELQARAADRMSVYSGASLGLSTEDLVLSAGGTLGVYGGESVSLSSAQISVDATEQLALRMRELDFVAGDAVLSLIHI